MLPVMVLLGLQFPHTPPTTCTQLLHSPDVWANGAGLMAGIPSFEISEVQGPIRLNKECMVRFNVLGHPVRLIGEYTDKAIITITAPDEDQPHTTIRAWVHPIGTTGSHLVLNIETPYEIDKENLKIALQTALFSCVGDNPYPHPVLREYRALLKQREA